MADPLPAQAPAYDRQAVVFDRPSALRTQAAVHFVEERNRSPYRGRNEPRGGFYAGGYAQVTTALTAASGLTLGQGQITLCSRSGAALTADGPTGVPCYNAGGAVNVGTIIAVLWIDGDWSACVAPCS